MKTKAQRIIALVMMLTMLAVSPCAYADSRGGDGWLNFANGGYVLIPAGFSETSSYGGPLYEFYNRYLDMWLCFSEDSTQTYGRQTENLINSNYDYYVSIYPDAVNKYKSDHSFALSGYAGDSMYYIQHVVDHGTLYTMELYYPSRNRRDCDRIVSSVTDSFRTQGYVRPSGSGGYSPWPSGTPSAADLDRIHANIKYPNYDFMYLDHYVIATVSHRAVYCFRDPDQDIWRRGNYYTVYRGTEVTILAESEGYACVIINSTGDAGWINMDYLSY